MDVLVKFFNGTLGKNKVYELVRGKGFPARKIGNKIIIHRDGFKLWLDQKFGIINDLPKELRLVKQKKAPDEIRRQAVQEMRNAK